MTLWATEIDLDVNPDARVYVLPCIAGHVGADSAGVILSEAPHLAAAMTLIIDVGTNAEIVLGNCEKLLAASSPTGPAFEGAQISGGQRAAPGAIERVRIDPQSLEPRFSVIGCELWSNDPGFEDELANGPGGQGVTGICGSGIIEAIAGLFLAGVIRRDGMIDGAMAERNPRIRAEGRTFSYLLHEGEPEIRIQQADVRAIQLAKAALYAGARLLMDRMGVDKVDRIRLAGAFGSHIDVKYAMVLGMIPDCDLEQVSSAANAAGTGARIALLNHASRGDIESRVRRIAEDTQRVRLLSAGPFRIPKDGRKSVGYIGVDALNIRQQEDLAALLQRADDLVIEFLRVKHIIVWRRFQFFGIHPQRPGIPIFRASN